MALSIFLELHVTTNSSPSASSPAKLGCSVTYEGEDAGEVDLDPEVNLITRVALYVLRCHNHHAFPVETQIHIKNPIPLGRGLGSSGAAVTAGVVLGNEVGKLGLDKARMLDYCLMIGEWAWNHRFLLLASFLFPLFFFSNMDRAPYIYGRYGRYKPRLSYLSLFKRGETLYVLTRVPQNAIQTMSLQRCTADSLELTSTS